MILEYKLLQWDTIFFGYNVGEARVKDFNSCDYDKLISELKKHDFKLVYIYPADEISSRSLGSKAPLADTKITLEKKAPDLISMSNVVNVESYIEDGQRDTLRNLALLSGTYSRFKTDANFTSDEFFRLYSEWIDKSLSREIADDVMVIRADGAVNGMVTYKYSNNILNIGLIAVDANSQGRGLGKKLMSAIENIALQKKASRITVATQQNNKAALEFYQSCNYHVADRKEIFHLWIY